MAASHSFKNETRHKLHILITLTQTQSTELACSLPTPTSPKNMNLTVSGCSCRLNAPTLLPNYSNPRYLPIVCKFVVQIREHCRLNYGPTLEIRAFSGESFPCGRTRRSRGREREKWVMLSFSSSAVPIEETQISSTETPAFRVKLQSLNGCKLGIGRYPDFEYNAEGGGGEGIAENLGNGRFAVKFDVQSLYIPALTYQTTKLLGLPLPPFLSIGIAPENLQGFIDQGSGKVELNFRAKFSLSLGSLYKPPPLLVETLLTTGAANGDLRSGRGQRLDSKGFCRLVGVATVVPINDAFINAFLSLPTECLADMSAHILVLS